MSNENLEELGAATILRRDSRAFLFATLLFLVSAYLQMITDSGELYLPLRDLTFLLSGYSSLFLGLRLAYATNRDSVFAVYRAFELAIPIAVLWVASGYILYALHEGEGSTPSL